MTAILTPVDSEAAPGASDVPTAVPLTFGVDADGATRFQPFGTQRTVSLQPGETLGVSIGMSRTALTGNPGDLLHSLLKVTDEGGLTEFYLPVRSEIIGVGGLWVGKAEITHVQNQLQTFEKDEDGNYLVDSNGQHIASMTNGNALVDTELNRTAQTLTLNLILHADEAGTSRLLSQVYYGVVAETTNGIPVDGLSRSQDALMAKHLDAAARVSAVHFPMGMDLALSGSVGAGATVNGTLSLGHDDAGNPFIHTYHPDHDNLDARFENPLPSGVESHRIDRAIALTFDSDPGEITDPAWGSTLFSGTYTETITGIHKNPIAISGVFAIRRVSEITNLQSN